MGKIKWGRAELPALEYLFNHEKLKHTYSQPLTPDILVYGWDPGIFPQNSDTARG